MEGSPIIMPVSGELHAPEQYDGKLQVHAEPCTPDSSVCSTKKPFFSPKSLKSMVCTVPAPCDLDAYFTMNGAAHILHVQMVAVSHAFYIA